MFSYRKIPFFLTIFMTFFFKQKYLFLQPVEAVNGVIWRKNLNDFVGIFSIDSFDKINQQRILISREKETHNFDGTQFRFTSFQMDNLVNFVANDTQVTGVHGDMWQTLAEMLNFKIHSKMLNAHEYGRRSENGSWSGLLGYIYRNETDIIPRCVILPPRSTAVDFTFATWMTSYRFYMKKQPQYHKTWMTELFDLRLWFSIIGIFFALTLASFSTHVLNLADKEPRDSISNLRDHFFYIFSIFCNQGWTPRQLDKRSKILIISTRLFAWLLVIAFSSKLISHIAEQKFHPPFNDLESFYKNTDYKLIVKKNSFVYSVFQTSSKPIYKTIIDAGRLFQAEQSEATEKICTGKYVYLESRDVVEAKNTTLCEITSVGKPFVTSWIASGLVRGFKYRKTIDLGMLKLSEFGILERLKSQWVKKARVMKIPGAFESIRLDHVYLIFGILAFAAILSLAILLIENIIYLGITQDLCRR